MMPKAFKAYKSEDGFITVLGFNGDSLTTKQPTLVREFAALLIRKHNDQAQEREHAAAVRRANAADSSTAE